MSTRYRTGVVSDFRLQSHQKGTSLIWSQHQIRTLLALTRYLCSSTCQVAEFSMGSTANARPANKPWPTQAWKSSLVTKYQLSSSSVYQRSKLFSCQADAGIMISSLLHDLGLIETCHASRNYINHDGLIGFGEAQRCNPNPTLRHMSLGKYVWSRLI